MAIIRIKLNSIWIEMFSMNKNTKLYWPNWMRRKNTQEKTIANVFKKLHWTCKDAECFFSGITTIRITYSGTYKKVDSILGCFESDPNILELACSLPVFDVLYINFNEQKIFKIYFIKKYGSLHFPKWYKNHYNGPLKEWKYFDHM